MRAGKTALLIIGVLVLVILIAGFLVFNSLTQSKTVTAQLHVESGEVLVDGSRVTGNVLLNTGNIIETIHGQGTVILYESVLISLAENTKITLPELFKQHPIVVQEKGKTWSKFTGLLGVEEYSVETANAVASVRATAFQVAENKVLVGEGTVQYDVNGQTFNVPIWRVAEIVDGQVIERAATAEERAEIIENIQGSIVELKYLRDLEINKEEKLLGMFQNQLDITDQDIQKAFEAADAGLVNVDTIKEYTSQIPFKVESINKVADITKEIQDLNRLLHEAR